MWDRELRFTRVNPALARLNGVPVQEHLGRRPSSFLGEIGVAGEQVLAEVLRTGRPVLDIDVDAETPAAPGRPRHFVASYYPVPEPEGDGLLGVGGVIVEVTGERRAAQAAVDATAAQRATSALLDAFYAGAPVGLAFWDGEGRYAQVNAALADLDGSAAEAYPGRTPLEVLGDRGAEIGRRVCEVLRSGGPVVDVQRLEHPGGQGGAVHHELTYYPVRSEDGKVVGVGGVIRDVTAERTLEQERSRLLREALTARAHAEAAQVRAEALREEAEAARRRAAFLVEAGQRLASVTTDFEETLREVAAIAVPAIADWCLFSLVEAGGSLRQVAMAATPEFDDAVRDIASRFPQQIDSNGVGEVIRTGEPLLVEDFTDDVLERLARGPEHFVALRKIDLQSALVVPLIVSGRTIGALSLVVSARSRAFGPDDLWLVESLATRAALAVDNARLLRERSHIAETLQRSLKAGPLPDIPGVELAARYRAAGDENEVGGDFYDAFLAEDGVWAVAVGDVTGKGAEAAALTSLTRHTLRAGALSGSSPRESVELLNTALWSQSHAQGRFATVVYARLCPDADGVTLTLASGGHPPPLVLRASGEVEEVQVAGTLVGALRDGRFGEVIVRLAPGDLLLLYTDGVTELRRRDVLFGEQALREVLGRQAGASADEVVAAVERSAVELQAGEPRDDIAVVAVRARP
jgi:PAS domain S-box-containing protein